MKAYSLAEIVKGSKAAPGRILIRRIEAVTVSAGGILVPQTNADMKGSIDRLSYGVVILCGEYCDFRGSLLDIPSWPLSGGTYIEYYRAQPFQCIDQLFVINTGDVTRFWAPGSPPPWWPSAGGENA